MNNQKIFNEVFFESNNSNQAAEEASFLDISELLFTHLQSPSNIFNFEESSPQHEIFFQVQSEQKEEAYFSAMKDEQSEKEEKKKPLKCKSMANKNVCYNICQKTIKVIKKGQYDEKVNQICQEMQVESEVFKNNMNRIKKDFTGPKALAQYLSKKTAESKAFAKFMKWFLSEKYLRHALIEGEMKDIKVYIQYKNQVILPLLE